jgi:hypothetical protein
MPSANRFLFLRETVRNHPVILATSAATAGVLLGAFVVMQALAPSKPHADVAAAPQAAIETRAAPKPVAETTGSASAGDNVASADCENQTWPYLSAVCTEELRNKNRGLRVISTDKLDKPTIAAIEAVPPASAAEPRPNVTAPPEVSAPPAVASTTPTTPLVPATASFFAPQAQPVPLTQPAATTPEPSVAAASEPAQPQPAAKNEAKEKRLAKKSKRRFKVDTKAPAKQDVDDDDEDSALRRVSDNRNERADRRRIVERWTERDYDDSNRRVTVVRRGGGGFLENLFGMGGD